MEGYGRLAILTLLAGLVASGLWASEMHPASAEGYGGGTGKSVLTFDPRSLTVQQGGTASAKVTVALASGKAGGTTMKISDVPGGVAVSFTPASGDPTFTTTMTVKATAAAKPGTYSLKVQATGNDPSEVAPYPLTIAQESSGS